MLYSRGTGPDKEASRSRLDVRAMLVGRADSPLPAWRCRPERIWSLPASASTAGRCLASAGHDRSLWRGPLHDRWSRALDLQPVPDPPAIDRRLAAGAQLPQQPLLGGLPIQVGHVLSDDLLTGNDVHGACLSGCDPAVGSNG